MQHLMLVSFFSTRTRVLAHNKRLELFRKQSFNCSAQIENLQNLKAILCLPKRFTLLRGTRASPYRPIPMRSPLKDSENRVKYKWHLPKNHLRRGTGIGLSAPSVASASVLSTRLQQK